MDRIAATVHAIESPPTLVDSWRGTLAEFFATYVVPWWPPPDRIAAWTEAAITWHERPDCLLLVRGNTDKGWLHQESGRRVVFTDNAPGIWILLRARDAGADPACWPELIEGGLLPVVKMRAGGRMDRPWTHATTALSRHDANVLWSIRGSRASRANKSGLKHCHIFDLRGRPGCTLTQRSLRNLALMNYFVFPNGNKHFRTEREGWSDEKNAMDLGESRTVCDYALHELILRVRSVAPDLPERFLSAAGAVMPSKPEGELRIRIERRDSTASMTLGACGRTLNSTSASRSRQVARREPNTRLWTLRRDNRAHCHGVVDLSESPLYLDLSWRPDSHGDEINVGLFRLDLHALLAGGYIRPDPVGSCGTRVRLRVTMRNDGRFCIQNKRDEPSWLLT